MRAMLRVDMRVQGHGSAHRREAASAFCRHWFPGPVERDAAVAATNSWRPRIMSRANAQAKKTRYTQIVC
jgi:hypothetical protein